MKKVAALHPGAWVESGLSDHESLSPVPVELIGTFHYLSIGAHHDCICRADGGPRE